MIRRVMPGARGIVLMYHRVVEAKLDPWALCVSPPDFAEQMEVLCRNARPMPLGTFVRACREGRLPDRTVVVTFDDGYHDNLHHARPLLERYDVPATIFVTGGSNRHVRAFWWDELGWILLAPRELPSSLSLDVGGSAYGWELGAAARYSEADARADRHRQPWESTPGSRLAFYYTVWSLLRPLPELAQRTALDALRAWAGVDPTPAPIDRAMTPDELHALAVGGPVSIGAHTWSHPLLPAHPAAVQHEEMLRNKQYLEALLGHRVDHFSYPFGAFTAETVAVAREVGFACACGIGFETVWRASDPLRLPRFQVQDWNGDTFATQLERWFQE